MKVMRREPMKASSITSVLCCFCMSFGLVNLSLCETKVRSSTHRTRRPLKVPPNFGKTNFIVGLPSEYIPLVNQVDAAYNDRNCIREVYFSPDDDLQQKLLSYIEKEKKAIYLAIFSFTDKKIAQALIEAHKRGVDVQVIADPSFLTDRFTKISFLEMEGVPIYMYDPKQSPNHKATYSNIMHNKFVLFENNIDNRPLVWTGSFNFTKSARLSNQENVVVLSHPKIVAKYEKQFAALKNRTIPYDPPTKRNDDKNK